RRARRGTTAKTSRRQSRSRPAFASNAVLLYGAARSTDETRIVYNFGAAQLLNSVINAFANGNAALV
ncbi:MAG: hypothetical protein AAF787_24465, partial [Chloroflexota bacterium]